MVAKLQQEYDTDFYSWTLHNAQLLREGKLSEIDVEHLAEEIEGMGKSERRELINRLAVLIADLLKWQFQPGRRGRSWQLIIREQRLQINHLFEESPSLKYEVESKINDAYEQAVIIAERETGLEGGAFTKTCSFSLHQLLDQNYFPE